MTYVIVPGIDGSGATHWQSRWEADTLPNAVRIAPPSWTRPVLDEWVIAIDDAVPDTDDALIVGHSLGCLAAAEWVLRAGPRRLAGTRGLFLVAPPDVRGPEFPAVAAATFLDIVPTELPVPALVVASDDDPYATPQATARLARAWGAGLVSVGRRGHLNSDSGIGEWPEGGRLLTAFQVGAKGHCTDARSAG